jgi:hypothetical protein
MGQLRLILGRTLIVMSFYCFCISAFAQEQGFKDDTFTTILSKKFDFEDTAIDGQAATPTGFMLRGRNSQQLSQLVTLRKDFSERLKSSSEGAKVVSAGLSD